MMVSGISLAAVAPFLSNEISKIECETIETEPTQGNSDEVSNLKIELQEKDLLVTQLEKELESKDLEIDKLVSRPDCDVAVQVVTVERDRLNEELNDLEAEAEENVSALNECREQLAACEKEVTSTPADCKRYTDQITRLEILLKAKDKEIEKLTKAQLPAVKCPQVSLTGAFHPEEVFNFNGNNFMVKLNSDDVGARYFFYHNNKDVTSSIRTVNKTRYYSFKDRNGNSYRVNFGRMLKNSIRFSLTPG